MSAQVWTVVPELERARRHARELLEGALPRTGHRCSVVDNGSLDGTPVDAVAG